MGHAMNFKIEIDKDRTYKLNLGEDLKIDEAQIDEHLTKHPDLAGWYATIAAQAKAKVERIEFELDEFEYRLDLDIREEASKDSDIKLTEPRIKALVKTDSKRLAIVNRLLEAKEQMEIAVAARDAFNHRKDCLISLGLNMRARYDSEMNINKKRQKE